MSLLSVNKVTDVRKIEILPDVRHRCCLRLKLLCTIVVEEKHDQVVLYVHVSLFILLRFYDVCLIE